MPQLPLANVELLAERIRAGEVVFFVGAGFSVDSEGLTAARLMRRLLLRLHVLDLLQPPAQRGRALRHFAALFSTPVTLTEIAARGQWAAIADLATRYYEVNECMVRAFGELLPAIAAATPDNPSLAAAATAIEAGARARIAQAALQHLPLPAAPSADVLSHLAWVTSWAEEPLQPIPAAWWDAARREHAAPDPARRALLGKLVFVQSLGFHDPQVMRGVPFNQLGTPFTPPDLQPRHHVLARFAREGFCPALVTTNFDLLLEAAFRLSGFGCGDTRRATPAAGLVTLQNFDVIASPQAFFEKGKAVRTATILKIHGCAGYLRWLHGDHVEPAAASAALEQQFHYLPQLVYTYREIQHWRDDSWAADYLRTLLRTRTMVFAGYSTSDPVLHDTFRCIYEEMERKTSRSSSPAPAFAASPSPAVPGGSAPPLPSGPLTTASGLLPATDGPASARTHPRRAPAYFLAYSSREDRQEFHAGEILRAASAAIGATPDQLDAPDHPNYLRFRPRGRPLTPPSRHLDVDEMLLWLHHRIFRSQQLTALRTHLAALLARLGFRQPASAVMQCIADFSRLLERERRAIHAAPTERESQRRLHEACGWSSGFHPALRREWARGLLLTRQPGRREAVAELDHPLWYFPASEQPDFTAWSAVVELALQHLGRHALRCWSGETPTPAAPAVQPTAALRPSVHLRQHASPSAPLLALTLQVRGFDRPGQRPRTPGHPARRTVWLLREDAVPWAAHLPSTPAAATTSAPASAASVTPVTPATLAPASAAAPMSGARHLSRDQICAAPAVADLWRWAQGDVTTRDVREALADWPREPAASAAAPAP